MDQETEKELPPLPEKLTNKLTSSIAVNFENTQPIHDFDENGLFPHLPHLASFDPIIIQSVKAASELVINNLTPNERNEPQNDGE